VARKRRAIGGAGVLGHASVERGDPHGLLLDDREQMDDQLTHSERGLFPTGGIQRKTCEKWESSRHRIPLMSSS
jgi:hypothetical protein